MADEAEVQELSHSIRMDRRAAVRYIFCCSYGMPTRKEWQLEGQTNTNTLYSRTLPGNSPEWMRGLDALGVADLTRAVLYHVALTSCLEVGDPLKSSSR